MRGQGRPAGRIALGWAAIALAAAALAAAPQGAAARTPAGFFGVVANGPLVAGDYARMGSGGVGKLRFLLSWRDVQPAPGTFDWSRVDAIVAGAAEQGIEPLPFVFGSPAWIGEEARPPLGSTAERQAWQAFLTAAVERYGRGGSFWAGRGGQGPIADWQVWNEPNYPLYWQPRPLPRDYAELLDLSAAAIRGADPRARILLAGVASVRTGPTPWDYLRKLYRVRGVERDFDAVALHPYSPNMIGVEYQLAQVRQTIVRAGDRRTPIEVTEIGWGSDGPKESPLVKGREGQARVLARAFELLRRKRERFRIGSVQWLSFQDAAESEPGCGFCQHTGLFTLEREPKPSWREFRRLARG
jgi:hypothetical protein